MALPYNSVANQPQGFTDVTITLIDYVVNSISNATATENRIISRTDSNGDRSDFMIRKGSDQVIVEFELQKEATTTINPLDGTEFTYDYDQSGTASTLVVVDTSVNRSVDDMTTISMRAVLKTYQA
jgi:hypothetical protein